MVRGLPVIYNQQHLRGLLGFSQSISFASSGCYITSLAMLASYYGKHIDPFDLNAAMQQKNLFVVNSALVSSDNALEEIFPDILFQEALLYPNDPPTPADLTKLTSLMADPSISVILEIDIGNGNTHFVVCLGVNGTVMIANPWTGQIEDFTTNYGDPVKNIIKFVVYKGTPISIDQQLTDQLRQQRDHNWDLYQGEIGLVKQKDNQLQQEQLKSEDLTKQLGDLKSKYDEECLKNVALNQANATISSENQDNGQKAYDAEHLAGLRLNYLNSYADKLGIKRAGIDEGNVAEKGLTEIDAIDSIVSEQDKQIKMLKKMPVITPQMMGDVKKNGFKITIQNFLALFWQGKSG